MKPHGVAAAPQPTARFAAEPALQSTSMFTPASSAGDPYAVHATVSTTGLSWQVVIPLAVVLMGSVALLAWSGSAGLSTARRQVLLGLRIIAAGALAVLLLEPVLTRQYRQTAKPVVAVLIDTSLSMAANDRHAAYGVRLDAAEALGFIDGNDRPHAARSVAQAAEDLLSGPELGAVNSSAIASPLEGLITLGTALGDDDLDQSLAELRDQWDGVIPASRAALIRAIEHAAVAIQARDDGALVMGADRGSRVRTALDQVARMRRADQAWAWAAQRLAPALAAHAEVQLLRLDRAASVLVQPAATGALTCAGITDPHAALTTLARRGGTPVAAVVMVSDGRRTSGDDPAVAARALHARGAKVHVVVVGDPDPLDLGVVAIVVPQQVARGATVPVEVRWRGHMGHREVDLAIAVDGRPWLRQRLHRSQDTDPNQIDRVSTAIPTPMTDLARTMTITAALVAAERTAASSARSATVDHAEIKSGTEPGFNGTDDWPLNDALTATVQISERTPRVLLIDRGPRWDMRTLRAYLLTEIQAEVAVRWGSGYPPVTSADIDAADVVVIGDVDGRELGALAERLAARVHSGATGLIIMAGEQTMPLGRVVPALAELLPVRRQAVALGAGSATAAVRLALTAAGSVHPLGALIGDGALDRRLWSLLPATHNVPRSVAIRPGAEALLVANDQVQTPAVVIGSAAAGRVLYVGPSDTWRWRERSGVRWQRAFWLAAVRWAMGELVPVSDQAERSERLNIATDPVAAQALAGAGGGIAVTPDAAHRVLAAVAAAVAEAHERFEVEVIPLWDRWWILLAVVAVLSAEWALRRRWGRV